MSWETIYQRNSEQRKRDEWVQNVGVKSIDHMKDIQDKAAPIRTTKDEVYKAALDIMVLVGCISRGQIRKIADNVVETNFSDKDMKFKRSVATSATKKVIGTFEHSIRNGLGSIAEIGPNIYGPNILASPSYEMIDALSLVLSQAKDIKLSHVFKAENPVQMVYFKEAKEEGAMQTLQPYCVVCMKKDAMYKTLEAIANIEDVAKEEHLPLSQTSLRKSKRQLRMAGKHATKNKYIFIYKDKNDILPHEEYAEFIDNAYMNCIIDIASYGEDAYAYTKFPKLLFVRPLVGK